MELDYRIMLRIYIMGPYHSIILHDNVTEYITELYDGIILRVYNTDFYYGIILQENITEIYYGIMLQDHTTGLY